LPVPEIMPPGEKETTPTTDKPTTIETRKYHTVIKGETLWRISKKYGTTVEAIKQLNGLKNNIISVIGSATCSDESEGFILSRLKVFRL